MTPGFGSPILAMQAVREALGDIVERYHLGHLGSGETLDCCPDPLVRIEWSAGRPREGAQLFRPKACRTIIVDMVVTYSSCFQAHTKAGTARSTADLTADGLGLVESWWDAMDRLACAQDHRLRFAFASAVTPMGNCAGWAITAEADVAVCPCHAQ